MIENDKKNIFLVDVIRKFLLDNGCKEQDSHSTNLVPMYNFCNSDVRIIILEYIGETSPKLDIKYITIEEKPSLYEGVFSDNEEELLGFLQTLLSRFKLERFYDTLG